MARRQLEVRIAKDGTVSAETFGMKGQECLDYIGVLEDLLEATTVSSDYTAEYHESAERDAVAERERVEDGRP